ncbi:DUF6876 family protein [Planctomycetota bacterium]
METKTLESDLRQFTGAVNYYRHWTGHGLFTDGVQYLAEQAGAYWLVDAIFSYRRREPFQVWTLKKNTDDNGAVLTMQEDTGEPVKVHQDIPFTDFPLDQIKLYLIDGVVLLPSEY